MRACTAPFVLLAIAFAGSLVNAHAGQPGFRHLRRGFTAGDAPAAFTDPTTNTGNPGTTIVGSVDPNSVTVTPAGTGGNNGIDVGEVPGSGVHNHVGGVGSGSHGEGAGGGGSVNNQQDTSLVGDAGGKKDDADGGDAGGKKDGAEGGDTGGKKDADGSLSTPADGGDTGGKEDTDGSLITPTNTDGTAKTDQPGLLGGEDDKSTPLPVTHSDFGAYPNSGSAFQQFYAFSPWVYVSSLVATGAANAKQPVAPVITLGVCRCERPFGSIADAQGLSKTASYGNSACLANVLAASSTSAQCHDAGIDQKQCVENGVPGQLAEGDKLWWQKTFCKRCVDAGGVSDPQFACFDNYLNTGLAQSSDGDGSTTAGQAVGDAGGS